MKKLETLAHQAIKYMDSIGSFMKSTREIIGDVVKALSIMRGEIISLEKRVSKLEGKDEE